MNKYPAGGNVSLQSEMFGFLKTSPESHSAEWRLKQMRRDHDILMKDTDPEGGKWNFDPKESIGKNARPFTTLYWDFLSRNHNRLKKIHGWVCSFATWIAKAIPIETKSARRPID